MTDLSVVMPVYNERHTVGAIVRKVLDQEIRELIIIDDGSTDGTQDLLRSLAGSDPRLRIYFRRRNRGKGAAVRAGIRMARGALIIVQDADLEYDPAEYPKLAAPILEGKADVVYGSRFTGSPRRVLLFWHQVGNSLLTLLSNMFTNLNLTDMETCYKMMKSDWVKDIPIRSNRFGFEPEITMKLAKLGARFYEVPIAYSGRSYAEGKKIGWRDGVQALKVILSFWLLDDLHAGARSPIRLADVSAVYTRYLYEKIQPYLGQRILELHAGRGAFTRYLLDRERVFATDFRPPYVRELALRFASFPNVEAGFFDPGRSDWPPVQPDTLLMLNVLERVGDDKALLREASSLLPSGGRLIGLVPLDPSLWGRLDRALGHRRRYTPPRIHTLLASAGLQGRAAWQVNRLGAVMWRLACRLPHPYRMTASAVRFFDLFFPLLERNASLPALSYLFVAEKQA